jgi:hypothetical protein
VLRATRAHVNVKVKNTNRGTRRTLLILFHYMYVHMYVHMYIHVQYVCMDTHMLYCNVHVVHVAVTLY